MKRTNIHLPEQTRSALQSNAENRGLTVAELVRRILDSWLARQAKKEQING